MATTNPVSQILVTSGNQAPLAAGGRIDTLAVGQVGVFSFHTGLSLGAASIVGDTRDIFLAVGLNKLGSGGGATLEDINRSAGQVLQVRNMKSYIVKGFTDALPKIVDVAGFTARCETDYIIKIEFRTGKSYAINGYNQFAKSFSFRTGCCVDQCEPCGEGICSELSLGLGAAINADADHLVTATYFANTITATVATEPTAAGDIVIRLGTGTVFTDYTVAIVDADTVTTAAAKIVAAINSQAGSPYRASNTLGAISITPKVATENSTETFVYQTPVAGMTIVPIVAATSTPVTDTAAFVAANPGACLGLRLTSNPIALQAFDSINLAYDKIRAVDMIVSITEGFTCNGTVTNIQNVREADGIGYDIKQREYVDGGWNGKPGPYRTSNITGLARRGFEFYANPAANYNIIALSYDQHSVGGWLEYLNNLETEVAIPCADTVTLIGLVAILDAIFTQFQPHTNDVAAMDCTNEEVHTINNPALDGIESLS